MSNHTIRQNDCGNCKHFNRWDLKRECEHFEKEITEDDLHLGDCDKIPKGQKFNYEVNGKEYEAEYDGYSFEDECYDEYFKCFEEADE